MTTSIEEFIRADRARLAAGAPPPHAARAWHRLRDLRTARLERALRVAAWMARAMAGTAALAALIFWRKDFPMLLLLALLVVWLSAAACAPRRRSFPEKSARHAAA